jgi:hypothetical protein
MSLRFCHCIRNTHQQLDPVEERPVQIAGDELESVEDRIRGEIAEARYPQALERLAQTYYDMVFRHCFYTYCMSRRNFRSGIHLRV